ncbi:MAG: ATP-binding protein [Planctomycetota bacterium]
MSHFVPTDNKALAAPPPSEEMVERWKPSKSIRARLVWNSTVIASVALLLAGLALAVLIWLQTRWYVAQNLLVEAGIFADIAGLELAYDREASGAQILNILSTDPKVVYAKLNRLDGSTFATYSAPGSLSAKRHANLGKSTEIGTRFQGLELIATQPVRHDHKVIGWLYIVQSLDELGLALVYGGVVMVIEFIAAAAVAYLLGMRLQRPISAPILELSATAEQVSAQHNFSLRAAKHSHDEIGILTDAFNDMLSQIQFRDSALNRANEVLEDRVAERTVELRTALEVADAASRAKSQFLANMSHEIRTPMSAILGHTEILLDLALENQEALHSLETIKRSGGHLLTIINDILDFSKIEAGKLSIENIEFSPAEVLKDVVQLLAPRATEKKLALRTVVSDALPSNAMGDPTRLRQVLINLISNAIKFTAEGAVQVDATLRATAETPARLEFVVRDSGIGMTAEQIDGLFRPFEQADASMTRRFGGTGLGLAISRNLARKMGGDLFVQSVPGEGSVFTLQVRYVAVETAVQGVEQVGQVLVPPESAPEHEGGESSTSAPSLAHVRVLSAEDSPDIQLLVRSFLSRAGYSFEMADNGLIAYERILSAKAAGQPFHVLITDMQMPEMDGYTLVRRLRASGFQMPIIALTAHATSNDRERCLEAGCDEFLSKPVPRRKFLEVLGSVLKRAESIQSHWRRAPAVREDSIADASATSPESSARV